MIIIVRKLRYRIHGLICIGHAYAVFKVPGLIARAASCEAYHQKHRHENHGSVKNSVSSLTTLDRLGKGNRHEVKVEYRKV